MSVHVCSPSLTDSKNCPSSSYRLTQPAFELSCICWTERPICCFASCSLSNYCVNHLVHVCRFAMIGTFCMEHAHLDIVLVNTVKFKIKSSLVKHLGRTAYILVLQTGYTNWWVSNSLPSPSRSIRESTCTLLYESDYMYIRTRTFG